MARTIKTKLTLVLCGILVAVPLLDSNLVSADRLSSRSVIVANSTAGVVTSHEFRFTIPGFSDLGSIKFEYCDSPLAEIACVVPAGFSASGASLSDQTGETGFSIQGGSPSNEIILTRGVSASSGIPVTYQLDNLTNPSAPNTPVYVRISTFASEDAAGPVTDFGAVAFSTARNIAVSGYVPPYIIFCVGITVQLNCSAATGSQLSFGELSASRTGALTSEYSGSTNDPGGFTTSVTGTTMTSGTNFIPAMSPAQSSQTGKGQFGINVRDNSNPDVGAERTGPGTSVPVGQAANANSFFLANEFLSSSPKSTDYNKFTVSYIVNVPANQTPGIYTTTLTYIAVAAF